MKNDDVRRCENENQKMNKVYITVGLARNWIFATMNIFKCATILALLIMGSSAFSASFDCKKASSKIEKWICSDSQLSKLDEDMADSYKDVRRIYPAILKEQREWLQSLKSCENIDCVKEKYEERISEFANIIVRAEREEGRKEQEKNIKTDNTVKSSARQSNDIVPLSRFYMSNGYWIKTNPEDGFQNNQSCRQIADQARSVTFFRFSPSQVQYISVMKGMPGNVQFSKPISIEILDDKELLQVAVFEPIDAGTLAIGYRINNSENLLGKFSEECLKCKSPQLFKFKPTAFKWCNGEP